MTSASDRRYVEFNERMSAVNGAGAGLITLLTLIWTFGRWHAFATVAITQAIVIVFNVALVNKILLRRWGVRRAELLRTIVNLGTGVLVNHFAGWPLPAWLFLPYVALIFDHLGRRIAISVTISMCVVQDIVALIDGIDWVIPVMFTAFAVFCSAISHVRFKVIRTMLTDADTQREALKQEIAAREHAEEELRHAQKLEAIGRIASGIAHEINTPIQFVGDSITFLREATDELFTWVERHRSAGDAEDLELDYLTEQVPLALGRSVEGLARVAAIVRSMKRFAHKGPMEWTLFDINEAIRMSVTMARGEYKHVAEVETDLASLPPISCQADEINQVVLNLLVNAAHAVGDAVKGKGGIGTITIRTRTDGETICVDVTDTGCGIPEDIADRIFEPFFTTKEVGRGSGQGLAIARSIVTAHGGTLAFRSEPGCPTTFTMRLPIREAQKAA